MFFGPQKIGFVKEKAGKGQQKRPFAAIFQEMRERQSLTALWDFPILYTSFLSPECSGQK